MQSIFVRIIAVFAAIAAAFGAGAPAMAAANADLRPVEFQLEASRRVGRTTFEYDYRVKISNRGATGYDNVIGQAASNNPATTVISNPLRFGSIPGSGQTSGAPLTLRQERTSPINLNALDWAFSGDPQQAATGLVEIDAEFAPEPEAPLSEGTFAEIGGARVELGEDGEGSIALAPGSYELKVVEPFQSSGSESVTVLSGETTRVRVELQRGFEQVDDASLEIVAPASRIIAAGRAFEIAARRAGSGEAVLTRLDYLLISPVFRGDDATSFAPTFLGQMNNLTEEFEIRNGRIAAKNPSALVEFLKTLPKGSLLIEAGASNEAAGIFYEAQLVADFGEYRLSGRVSRPDGAPTFPLAGAKISAAILGTATVVETTLNAGGSFVFEALPHGAVGLSTEIESGGFFYTLNEVVDLEANVETTFGLRGPPTEAAAKRRSRRSAAATPEEAEGLANLVFAGSPFTASRTVAVTGSTAEPVRSTKTFVFASTATSASLTLQVASSDGTNYIEYINDLADEGNIDDDTTWEDDKWGVVVRNKSGQVVMALAKNISGLRTGLQRWPFADWNNSDADNDHVRGDDEGDGCDDEEDEEFPPSGVEVDCIVYARTPIVGVDVDLTSVPIEDGMKTVVVEVFAENVGDALLDTLVAAEFIGGASFYLQQTGEISFVSGAKGRQATDRPVISVPDSVKRENFFDRSIQFEIISSTESPVKRRDLVAAKSFALVGGREEEMLTDASRLLPDFDDAKFWLPVQFKSGITKPSPFGETPEGSEIAFRIEARTMDGREGKGQSKTLTALWHMKDYQDADERFSRPEDEGYDDWSSEDMFYWLQTRQPGLTKTRVNDVSGEFGRDIGHATHGLGRDVDVLHFGQVFNSKLGKANYRAVAELALAAARDDVAAKATLTAWIEAQRRALTTLDGDSFVQKVYGPLGAPSPAPPVNLLKAGWLADLILRGRTSLNPTTANPNPGDLVVGGSLGVSPPLRNTKFVPRADHNDHYHISLN